MGCRECGQVGAALVALARGSDPLAVIRKFETASGQVTDANGASASARGADIPLPLTDSWRKFIADHGDGERAYVGSNLQVGGRVNIVVSLETLLGLTTGGDGPLPPHIAQQVQDVAIQAVKAGLRLPVDVQTLTDVEIETGHGAGPATPLYTELVRGGTVVGDPLFVSPGSGDGIFLVGIKSGTQGTSKTNPLYFAPNAPLDLARGATADKPLFVSGGTGGGGGLIPGGGVGLNTPTGTFEDRNPVSPVTIPVPTGKIPVMTGYYRMVLNQLVMNQAAQNVFRAGGGGRLEILFGNGVFTTAQTFEADQMTSTGRIPGNGVRTGWRGIPSSRVPNMYCAGNMDHSASSVVGCTIFANIGIETLIPAPSSEPSPIPRPRDARGRFVKVTAVK